MGEQQDSGQMQGMKLVSSAEKQRLSVRPAEIQVQQALRIKKNKAANKVFVNMQRKEMAGHSSLQAPAVSSVQLGKSVCVDVAPSGSILVGIKASNSLDEQIATMGRTVDKRKMLHKSNQEKYRNATQVVEEMPKRDSAQNTRTPCLNLFYDNRGIAQGFKMETKGPSAGPVVPEEEEIDDLANVFGFAIIGYVAGRSP